MSHKFVLSQAREAPRDSYWVHISGDHQTHSSLLGVVVHKFLTNLSCTIFSSQLRSKCTTKTLPELPDTRFWIEQAFEFHFSNPRSNVVLVHLSMSDNIFPITMSAFDKCQCFLGLGPYLVFCEDIGIQMLIEYKSSFLDSLWSITVTTRNEAHSYIWSLVMLQWGGFCTPCSTTSILTKGQLQCKAFRIFSKCFWVQGFVASYFWTLNFEYFYLIQVQPNIKAKFEKSPLPKTQIPPHLNWLV